MKVYEDEAKLLLLCITKSKQALSDILLKGGLTKEQQAQGSEFFIRVTILEKRLMAAIEEELKEDDDD